MTALYNDSCETQAERRERVCTHFVTELKAGTRPRIEEYIDQVFDAERLDLLAELIREEHAYRWKAGELPTLTDYTKCFPDLADVVLRAFLTPNDEGGVPFALLRTLGAGEFGTVFLAKETTQTGRDVAVKVLNPKYVSDDKATSQFKQEIRTVANIQQPGIVRVYYDGRFGDKGPYYVVMEYIAGQSLKELIKSASNNRIDPIQAAKLMVEVAKAVHVVHEHGAKSCALVHRDLKPANILLDQDGKPHVADFGLAAPVAELHDGKAGAGGTISYMSPEQVRALRQARATKRPGMVDRRSDVWSLGAILYELVTGFPPFIDTNNDDVMKAIEQYEPSVPSDFKVPAPLDAIIRKCLVKDPNDRFQTARAFADELAPFAESDRPSASFSRDWGTTGIPPKYLQWHGTFVGRGHQLAMLTEQIQAGCVIHVNGQTDSGKTSLLCKFFSTEESRASLARANVSPANQPIGVCYIDLSSYEYCPFPVLRGLAKVLGDAAKIPDVSLSERQLQHQLLVNVMPEVFGEIFPIIVFDEADAVLENLKTRTQLDELLARNDFRLACTLIATTAAEVPDGKHKRKVARTILIPDGLTPDDETSVRLILADALGNQTVAAEAVTLLSTEGMVSLFHPRDIAEAETVIRGKRADWEYRGSDDVVNLLYSVNDDKAIAPVWDELKLMGLSEPAIQEGQLSLLGWLLAMAVIGRVTLSASTLERHIPAALLAELVAAGLLLRKDDAISLSARCCRVLRIHLADNVLPSAGSESQKLFAAAVADLFNSTFQTISVSESSAGEIDEAFSWVKRHASTAEVLVNTVADYLVRTSIDDAIFPLERDAVLKTVARPEIEEDPWDQRLSQRLAAFVAACRLDLPRDELFSAFARAVDAAERVKLLQGEDLRALDSCALIVTDRYRRFAEILAIRERLVHRIREDVHDYAEIDVRLTKWAASWFLNCGTLALRTGQMSQVQEYLYFARDVIVQLPSPRSAYARADAVWLESRFATLEAEAQSEPSLRKIKFEKAATLAEEALNQSRGQGGSCHRYLAAIRRLVAEIHESVDRHRALDAAMAKLCVTFGVSDLQETPRHVRAGAARLIRESAAFSYGYDSRLPLGLKAASLLESDESALRDAAKHGEADELMELARCWSFIGDSYDGLDQQKAAAEYFEKARRLAEVAILDAPTTTAWGFYLRVLDSETTRIRTPNVCFDHERARPSIANPLRKQMTAYRQWEKMAQHVDGRVALWCWERKWQEEGQFEQIAHNKYGERWIELSAAQRRNEIRRRYLDRKEHLQGIKDEFEPFPEVFIALAWHETQHQRLLAMPQNCPKGEKNRGIFDPTPVLEIFQHAREKLPDNWRWTEFEAQFYRYVWDHRQAMERYRDAIRLAPRGEEQRRLKTDYAEVLLTAATFEVDGRESEHYERMQWLQEALDLVADVEHFERQARAASMVRDRIELELGKPIDWPRLENAYRLVFEDDDYANSVIRHLTVLREEGATVSVELAQAVRTHFTDIDVLRSFGSLWLRRSEREPNAAEAMLFARHAYAVFNACRILEEGRPGIRAEFSITRFQRARTILVAVEKSGELSPFGIECEKDYKNELAYAESRFQSVADCSVNQFRRQAIASATKCQRMQSAIR